MKGTLDQLNFSSYKEDITMTMNFLKRLYNRGQKMSTRQVLNTNNLPLKLTAQQHDLKEVWRREQKTLIGKAMLAEYDHTIGILRHRFC